MWKETKSQPSPDKTDGNTLKLRVVLMGGVGCSLLLPQHLEAAGTSRALHPLGHHREQNQDTEARQFSQVISGEKKAHPPLFSGWYNNLIYSCFASTITARQTTRRITYQETKARKPAAQPTVEITLPCLIRCPARASVGRETPMRMLLMNKWSFMQGYWTSCPCPSHWYTISVRWRIYMGSCPLVLTGAQVRSCLHSWWQEYMVVRLPVMNRIRKKIKMGRDYWRSLAQIPTHSRVNAKAVSGCSGPWSGKSCTSPRVFLSGYMRKSEGVSSASTGNETPDLHPISISFIRSLALVLLLRGER